MWIPVIEQCLLVYSYRVHIGRQRCDIREFQVYLQTYFYDTNVSFLQLEVSLFNLKTPSNICRLTCSTVWMQGPEAWRCLHAC